MSTILSQSETNLDPHWDAELYKKNSIILQQTSALELIEQLDIKQDDHILDVGCGDGKITIELAKKAYIGKVDGFDLSQDMIELAQKEYQNIANLSFLLGDASNFLYKQKFDWIVSFFCLQWVNNKVKSFKLLFDHLKPKGKIAIITTDRNPYLLKIRTYLIQDTDFKKYFTDYVDATEVIDHDDYNTYATIAGFQNIVYFENTKTIFFDDSAKLRLFIKMVTPALKYLPTADLRESFLSQLVEGYLSIVPEINNTKNSITYTIKTLLARK
jgi:ubiquinone/menaquinone biosynthesis C-methylase UbiE